MSSEKRIKKEGRKNEHKKTKTTPSPIKHKTYTRTKRIHKQTHPANTKNKNTIRPGLHKRKPRLHTAPHGTDHIPNKIPRQQNKRIIAKIRPVKHPDRKTPKRTARRL